MDALRKSLLFVSVPLVLVIVVGTIRARVDESRDQVLRDLKVFSETLYLVTNYYVEDVHLGQLERGAFQGLAESLDPWSSYWDPMRMEKLLGRDESAGVGLLLVKSPQGYVLVASVLEGSPADEAKVRQGQFLEMIDGLATKDLTLLEAQHMLRGPAGSTVDLGFFRQYGEESGEHLTLTRQSLDALQVVTEHPAEGVGLLRVSSLEKGVSARAEQALRSLREEGVNKLVLDLRANFGGSLDEAVALTDLFVAARPVFAERGRDGLQVRSTKAPALWDGELVVLVGRGTVGEAELVARALRESEAGPLVGQATFGKRSRQETVRLRDGSGLHLSVAEYVAPDGEALEDGGVSPTEEVAPLDLDGDQESEGEESGEAGEPQAEPTPESAADPQLERALEILNGSAAESKAA